MKAAERTLCSGGSRRRLDEGGRDEVPDELLGFDEEVFRLRGRGGTLSLMVLSRSVAISLREGSGQSECRVAPTWRAGVGCEGARELLAAIRPSGVRA